MIQTIKMILAFPFLILVFIWYWILIMSVFIFFLISEDKVIADIETKKLIRYINLYSNN
jgi:hypothetical protein